MITGLAYVAASLGISLLLIIASREAHESTDDTDYFRYPKAIRFAVLIFVPVWVVMSALVRFTPRQGVDGPLAINIISASFFCAAIGFLIGYVYATRFYFAVNRKEVRWRSFNREYILDYSNIECIKHRRLDKGRQDLSIQSRGKVLLVLSSTLQDFEVLKNLVIGNAKLHGVKIVSK